MRLQSIYIKNFRAIEYLEIKNVSKFMILAGANGCGKSSVFDAIRLLKSSYGEYYPSELQSFLQEFLINGQNKLKGIKKLFRDPSKEIEIRASFVIDESEKLFLLENLDDLLKENFWRLGYPGMAYGYTETMDLLMTRLRDFDEKTFVEDCKSKILQELKEKEQVAVLKINTKPKFEYPSESLLMHLIFRIFSPREVGVLEYHPASRSYIRESVQGINLQNPSFSDQYKHHMLYNTDNKYRNIKAEILQEYIISSLIIDQNISKIQDLPTSLSKTSLKDSLNDLFATFFPGKKFIGLKASKDGDINFFVELSSGAQHEIDELSAGEKEILFGYLRLRNNAPQNSIILFDEPELHLNPRLLKDLPSFYRKNIGAPLNNQIWLTTHSDSLLRNTIDDSDFSIYHISPASDLGNFRNQAILVKASTELERVVFDLVGNLAAYNPKSKIIILEGGGNTNFDVQMVSKLFPEISEQVSLISGSDKYNVTTLQTMLDKAAKDAGIASRFYSIVDQDYEGPKLTSNQYSWDVYSIENYLLDSQFILEVFKDMDPHIPLTEAEIEEDLFGIAREIMTKMIYDRLNIVLNKKVMKCIRFGRAGEDMVDDFYNSVLNSHEKMAKLLEGELSRDNIEKFKIEIEQDLQESLTSGTWKKKFKGKEILKLFVGQKKYVKGVSLNFEALANLIIGKMASRNYQPPGMKKVIDEILCDK
ncbi:AAA family ATPase [Limnothrix sp. FACHB-1083]|uniref:AAA family ATPase n=1 Tax=unclassified Limnothrix TaxID=2632864 RepID=UPI001680A517|nr:MULTISPECIES: AAA family ATPase [unclassified Limnothrix]MBD2159257.1 AAA family ATPase [Limnothrix sp. FACHB-1083]MBD2191962.1 AAA family ATPase [Limnothrix sp. FACHB-1088]